MNNVGYTYTYPVPQDSSYFTTYTTSAATYYYTPSTDGSAPVRVIYYEPTTIEIDKYGFKKDIDKILELD
jgi:hypothetical protein